MPSPVDTLKAFQTAMTQNDFEVLKRLLHLDYRFRGPMMQTDGAGAFLGALQQMSARLQFHDVEMFEKGDTVAAFYTCEFLQPFTGSFRMAERVEVRDGRLVASELIYDSHPFPR